VYYVNYNLEEAYQHFGKSLGAEKNNGDKLKFSIYHDWKKVRNRITVSYDRFGWQSLNDTLLSGVYWNGYDQSDLIVQKPGENFTTRDLTLRYEVRYSKYASLSIDYLNSTIQTNSGNKTDNGVGVAITLFPQIFYQTKFDFLK